MTELYLVRHGETVDNVNKIMQGQTQGQLTPEGEHQARLLAQQLADTHFDFFVSSDLKRAIDTCRIIAEERGMPVQTTPLLRERDWGGFTGKYIPDLKDAVWPADIETLDAMKQRASAFLDYIKTEYCGKKVLAVGHGIINKAIQSVYTGKPMNEIKKMENAEVRVLTL
jgi:broad specificity phosphatase PhoE